MYSHHQQGGTEEESRHRRTFNPPAAAPSHAWHEEQYHQEQQLDPSSFALPTPSSSSSGPATVSLPQFHPSTYSPSEIYRAEVGLGAGGSGGSVQYQDSSFPESSWGTYGGSSEFSGGQSTLAGDLMGQQQPLEQYYLPQQPPPPAPYPFPPPPQSQPSFHPSTQQLYAPLHQPYSSTAHLPPSQHASTTTQKRRIPDDENRFLAFSSSAGSLNPDAPAPVAPGSYPEWLPQPPPPPSAPQQRRSARPSFVPPPLPAPAAQTFEPQLVEEVGAYDYPPRSYGGGQNSVSVGDGRGGAGYEVGRGGLPSGMSSMAYESPYLEYASQTYVQPYQGGQDGSVYSVVDETTHQDQPQPSSFFFSPAQHFSPAFASPSDFQHTLAPSSVGDYRPPPQPHYRSQTNTSSSSSLSRSFSLSRSNSQSTATSTIWTPAMSSYEVSQPQYPSSSSYALPLETGTGGHPSRPPPAVVPSSVAATAVSDPTITLAYPDLSAFAPPPSSSFSLPNPPNAFPAFSLTPSRLHSTHTPSALTLTPPACSPPTTTTTNTAASALPTPPLPSSSASAPLQRARSSPPFDTTSRNTVDVDILLLASHRRRLHSTLPPPLAFKPPKRGSAAAPAAAPAAGSSASSFTTTAAAVGAGGMEGSVAQKQSRGARLKELAEVERGRVNKNASGTAVVSLEVAVRCGAANCRGRRGGARGGGGGGGGGGGRSGSEKEKNKGKGALLARAVLRALSPSMLDALASHDAQNRPASELVETQGARCWACEGREEGQEGVSRAGEAFEGCKVAKAAAKRERERLEKEKERRESGREGGGEPEEEKERSEDGDGDAEQKKGYEATLSAAVDRLEGLNLAPSSSATPGGGSGGFDGASPASVGGSEGGATEEKGEWEDLLLLEEQMVGSAGGRKAEVLKCDVCSLTCGFGVLVPSSLAPPPDVITVRTPAPFTVEIICARCDELFKCCSDCGGGGGRLTPGRWRSRELFPEGRKTCKLSHARNPALGEVQVDVLPLSPTPPPFLESLTARCRQIYHNSRLNAIARPEFLLAGDGLARTFEQVEKVTTDHWNLLSGLLSEDQPDEGTGVKRYLSLMYSTPRKRHNKRKDGVEEKAGKGSKETARVAFGFSLAVADFNDGTFFYCCVMPWPTNGQVFDAITLLGESTLARVKTDLAALNALRTTSTPPLEPYPPLAYLYLISPFKPDSKANVPLSRRGYEPLEGLLARDDGCRREWFPHIKEIWLPRQYAAALHVYVRRLESPDDLGGPPPENAPRKRVKKAAAPSPRPPSELFFSPASASQSPLLQQSAQPPAGGVQPLWQPPFHPSF